MESGAASDPRLTMATVICVNVGDASDATALAEGCGGGSSEGCGGDSFLPVGLGCTVILPPHPWLLARSNHAAKLLWWRLF